MLGGVVADFPKADSQARGWGGLGGWQSGERGWGGARRLPGARVGVWGRLLNLNSSEASAFPFIFLSLSSNNALVKQNIF